MKKYQITIDTEENKPVFFEMLPPGALFYCQDDLAKMVHIKLPYNWLLDFNSINLSSNCMRTDMYEQVLCIQINSLTIKSQNNAK